jgi:hypothetical protein
VCVCGDFVWGCCSTIYIDFKQIERWAILVEEILWKIEFFPSSSTFQGGKVAGEDIEGWWFVFISWGFR